MATDVSSGQYKLDRRAGHYTQVIGDSLYLWGGLQPNFPRVHNNDEKKRLTSQIQIFNITSGKWDTKHTIGNPPLGLVRYSCTALKNKIYYFGGWCRHDNCFHNSLNELDISTLTWTQISPTDDVRPVMKRGYGGMMLTKYGGVYCLLVIGGQGSPPSTKLPQAQYIDFPDGRVRTNEQNLYNISTNEWTIPDISGQCMPPNNSFVMEMIHNTRAIIFGGFVEDSRSSNTVYIVDIINNTLHWQTISKPDPVVQWPEERYLHAASIITVSISPILVVIGGVDNDDKTLKDCWILDISKKSWTEINLPNSVTERWAHSLSTYMMGPHCVWLVTVGNGETYNDSYVTDPNITMLIELVLNDDQWSVGFVLDSNELTSTDNYQQRVLKQLTEVRRQWIEQQQTKSTQDNLSTKETVLQTNYQDDLLVAQQNIQSLQERLLELESQQDRQQVPTTSHLDLMHEKDSYIAQLTRKLQTVTKEKEEIITTLQIQLKEYKQQKLPMAPKMTTDVISYLPKLAVVLQPVQEDWELLGHQLNIDQSVLTDIRSKRDSTEQMKYLLEEWSKKGGTLTQLQEALLHIGKKDVISGLVALQDKEHMYTDISVQISTDYSDKCIQCDYWNNTDVSNLFKGMVTVGKKLCLYNAHTNHELLVEQCGLRLVIPAEVITPVESIYEVAAQGLWGGTFVFPKGSTLISGVCHILVSSPFELTKPVTVELMHCAQILDERQSQCLSFVVAKSGPPFKFECLPGGSFSTESQYGTISLKKFSLIAIVIVAATELRGIAAAGAAVGGAVMGAAFLGTSGIVAGSVIGFVAARYFVRGNDVKCPNCYYRAYVFYKCISPKKWTMNFVVSQDSHYSKFVLDLVSYKFGIEHSNFRFRFAIYNSCVEEETLVPQVPINQETTIRLSGFPTNDVMINGWKVQPLQTPTVVNKTDVDDFTNSWSTDPPCVPVSVLADPDCIGFKNHLQHSLTIEGIEVTASKCQTQATDVSQCTVVIDISLDDYIHSTAYMHTEDPRRSLQLVTDDILNSEIARQTLVQCTYIIVESCIDPFVLARRVYSKEIISEDVYMRVKDKQTRDTNEERLETILDCLKNRVKYNADILKKFLVILRYISQNELADNITAKYNELATSSTQM